MEKLQKQHEVQVLTRKREEHSGCSSIRRITSVHGAAIAVDFKFGTLFSFDFIFELRAPVSCVRHKNYTIATACFNVYSN